MTWVAKADLRPGDVIVGFASIYQTTMPVDPPTRLNVPLRGRETYVRTTHAGKLECENSTLMGRRLFHYVERQDYANPESAARLREFLEKLCT